MTYLYKITSPVILLVIFILQSPGFSITRSTVSVNITKVTEKVLFYKINTQPAINRYSDLILVNNNISELQADSNNKYKYESPLRRFEITFFISAPFVFAFTFLSLYTYGAIRHHDTKITPWKEYRPALLIGTFGICSAIAAREAWITKKENDKNKSTNDPVINFYAVKNF
jgi:hypothetical protein